MGFSVCFGFFGGYIFLGGGGFCVFCFALSILFVCFCFVLCFFFYIFDGNEVCWIETIMC